MSWDPIWEDIFQANAWGKYPTEDVIRFVASNFYRCPNRSDVNLLEVGCGTGANLWYVAREGFSVVGIDGSSTAIGRARDRLDAEVPGWKGRLVVGDMEHLDIPDNSMDGVLDSVAVCTNDFATACKIYNEIARVLKPKGKLYARMFSTTSVGDQTGKKVGHNAWLPSEGPLEGKGYSRFTDPNELPELLSAFNILSVEMVTRSWGGYASNKAVKELSVAAEKR